MSPLSSFLTLHFPILFFLMTTTSLVKLWRAIAFYYEIVGMVFITPSLVMTGWALTSFSSIGSFLNSHQNSWTLIWIKYAESIWYWILLTNSPLKSTLDLANILVIILIRKPGWVIPFTIEHVVKYPIDQIVWKISG